MPSANDEDSIRRLLLLRVLMLYCFLVSDGLHNEKYAALVAFIGLASTLMAAVEVRHAKCEFSQVRLAWSIRHCMALGEVMNELRPSTWHTRLRYTTTGCQR